MKTICLGIAIILFSIVINMTSSGGLTLGFYIGLGGLIISLVGYFKEDSK